jgi:ATP-dependent helicase HrpB
MTPLPIDDHLPQIVAHARDARRLVLVASPGAGKTTRVPPAVLAANLLPREHPNLVMLQPRRVAVRAAAERIADEQDWRVGEQVGYHIRFDRRIGRDTRLRVVTEGILTRQLMDDPLLDGVGCVILDEFHERSIHTDLAAALLKEVRAARPELIVVVMSATLDAAPVARFFDDAPIVHVAGRTYPIEISYSQPSGAMLEERVAGAVAAVLDDMTRDDAGDLLVFLPGAGEINRAARSLGAIAARHSSVILPLHGSLPPVEQSRALRPADRRKIILATNIAETSLTIDGVRTVVDSGLARVAGYDVRRGLDRLDVKRISKASATQRAGRAGRTAPGRCVRLWTQREQNELDEFELPEIRRVDLAATVLMLHAWGRPDVRAFDWYESPDEPALLTAERLLFLLGLTDAPVNGKITPRGLRAAAMPVHPRLGRLLVDAAEAGAFPEGCTLAAMMSERDFVVTEGRPHERVARTHGRSDVLWRMDLLEQRDSSLDADAARQVAQVRDQLLRLGPLANSSHHAPVDEDRLLRLILSAYPDRVCRRRENDPTAAVMVGGAGVRLANESVVRTEPFFIAVDARADDRARAGEALVRLASAVELQWLRETFPQSVATTVEAVYDEARDRVVGRAVERYLDMVLTDRQGVAVDARRASEVLAGALWPQAAEIVAGVSEVASLMARLHLLAAALPAHLRPREDWPGDLIDPKALLVEACAEATSLAEVRRRLPQVAAGRLTYQDQSTVDRFAPESIVVPSGSRMKLDWSASRVEPQVIGPVLAVRLQEVFGWVDTPRVAGETIPVVLHLLGPNYRPVQVTQDLRSFWANTYFQVKKDLKARYPKHAWPDDPLTAPAERKGRSTKG